MKRLLFDIEANGLLDKVSKFHCAVVLDLDTEEYYKFRPNQFNEFCNIISKAEYLAGHYILSYDIPALEKLNSSFHTEAEIYDTVICGQIAWPDIVNQYDYRAWRRGKFPGKLIGKHSLEAYGHRLGILKGDYCKRENAWEKFSEEMLDYCLNDVRVNYELYKRLQKQNLSQEAISIEHKFRYIMNQQEKWGFKFNVSKAAVLLARLNQRKQELYEPLQKAFPPWKKSLGIFVPKANNKRYGYQKGVPIERFKEITFNPNSRDHIADRLIAKYGWKPEKFNEKDKKPTIDDEIIAALPYPEAPLLAEYMMIMKRLGQLSEGKQAWLRFEKDGRIHGRMHTMGTVTSRCSHSDPNIAQVPASNVPYGKECRELFEADDGWVLVGCDASGLELRNLAHRMNDPEYTKEILSGDIHTANQKAAGLPDRPTAKKFIYAFLYGAGNVLIGLMVLGSGFSDEEYNAKGKAVKKKFLNAIPGLKNLKKKLEKVAKARKLNCFIYGLDKRKVPVRSIHSILNTLFQSDGAIVMKKACIIAWDDLIKAGYKPGKDFKFVANIHDEMQTTCKPEIAEDVGKIKAEAIRKAGRYFKYNCPLDAEYKIGRNWSETH